MAYVLFVALCAVWGTNFLLMKKAGLWFTPISIGALRVFGGALLLFVVFYLRRRPWPIKRQHLAALAFVVMLGYVWPFVIQPYLILRCGSGFIGMMVSFVPLLTIVVSVPMLGIYPSIRQLIGVAVGLALLLLILADGIDREIAPLHFVLAISVPLAYTISNTFIKRRFVGMSSLPLALCCLSMASLVMMPFAAANPSQPAAVADQFPLAVACVVVLGVLGTGFGAVAFTKLLQDHGPLFAGMVTYMIPSIALILGWLDGETVTPKQVIALIGVFSMIALVQFGAARQARQVAA